MRHQPRLRHLPAEHLVESKHRHSLSALAHDAGWVRRLTRCSVLTAAQIPEISTAIAHLRDVLGDKTYESFARKGEAMTTAVMVTYAYDQIDQARTELNAVSE